MEWVDFGEAVNFIAFGSFINKPPANIEERSVTKLRNEAAALLCQQEDLTINAVFNKAVCFNGGQWPLRATHTIEINLPDVGEETAEIEIPKTFETINDFLKRQKADGMDISGYVISIKNENEAVAYDISATPNPEFYFSCPHFSKREIESRFPVSLLKRKENKSIPATEPTAESIERPMTQQERGRKGGKADKRNKNVKAFVENYVFKNQTVSFAAAWNDWEKKYKEESPYKNGTTEIYFTKDYVFVCSDKTKRIKKQCVKENYFDRIKK